MKWLDLWERQACVQNYEQYERNASIGVNFWGIQGLEARVRPGVFLEGVQHPLDLGALALSAQGGPSPSAPPPPGFPCTPFFGGLPTARLSQGFSSRAAVNFLFFGVLPRLVLSLFAAAAAAALNFKVWGLFPSLFLSKLVGGEEPASSFELFQGN